MKKNLLIIVISLLSLTTVIAQTTKPDALQLYRNGRYAESVSVCLEEINENGNNLDSYAVLCWSLIANKQYTEAEYWSEKGRSVSKYDPRLVEVQAESKFYLGQNAVALTLFQEYISLVPTSGSRFGEAYYFMGEIYIRQAKYNHADMAFTQAVRTEPLIDSWWVRLGYAREMAGNYSGAAAAYQKALSLNPNQSEARSGNSRVASRL